MNPYKKQFKAALAEAETAEHKGQIIQAYLAMLFDIEIEDVNILHLLLEPRMDDDCT